MFSSSAAFSPADWQDGIDIVLLTHSTEYQKSTNTGVLVQQSLLPGRVRVRRVSWSRVEPDALLIKSLSEQCSFLLYPEPEALILDVDHWQLHWQQQATPESTQLLQQQPVGTQRRCIQLILLDATWQLARKMYNQSPYLQQIPSIRLQSARPSQYLLRRNQTSDGWCTAETVVLLLTAFGFVAEATLLQQSFECFNQRS